MADGSSGLDEWAVTGLGPGSLIAGYRVEARIGAGGMAVVLRARDVKLGRTVALKIVAPALAENGEFRERFERESRAVAAVDHPHIIPVYAAGEANGVLYLAMRFIPGGDLRSLVQREGPLPADRAIALLSPIAAALDAAHRTGLLHRDVKPANILIDSSPDRPEHPYLSDFGLAKGGTSATGLTGTGQFVGTPDYAAPEQIAGKPARPQTDQYALACVAYAALTGTHPFAKDESMAVLWAHMYEPPPSLAVRRPDLPAAVDPVLARALAKAPEDRFATCGEFADALRAALSAPAGAGLGARFGTPGRSATETADWPWRADRSAQAVDAHASGMAPGLAVAPEPGLAVSRGVPVESPPVPPVNAVTGPLPPGRSRQRRDAMGGSGDGGQGRRRWPVITALAVGITVLVDGGLAAWLYSHGQAANAANPASPSTVTRTVTVAAKPKVVRTVVTSGPNGAPQTVVTTIQGPAQTTTATATKTITLTKGGPTETVTVTATPTATPAVTVTTTVTVTATVTETPLPG